VFESGFGSFSGEEPSMKFLVVGYGSIGKRHGRLLREMGHDVKSVDPYVDGADYRSLSYIASSGSDWAGVLLCMHLPARAHVLAWGGTGIKQWFIEKPVLPKPNMPDKTMVGFCYRWFPNLDFFRARLEDCRVYSATVMAGHSLQGWHDVDYTTRYHGTPGVGGVINDSLSHVLYVARWLLGELEVVGSVSGKLSGLDIQTEDVAAVLLKTATGIPVYTRVDYLSDPRHFRIEVVTSKGIIDWVFEPHRVDEMYRRQMEVFVEVCEGKRRYGYPTFLDGLAVHELCEIVRGS
jgi:predicted dehydrogenase